MSNSILQIARPLYSADTASSQNLSFSSEWRTPKIFLQTSDASTSLEFLGYVPSFMGFRQLSSSIITRTSSATYISSGFDSNDYTFSISSTIDSPANGGVTMLETLSGLVLYVGGYSGGFFGHDWADAGASAIVFFDPLSDDSPTDLSLEKKPGLIVASEGGGIEDHPSELSLDSRFDTFKIFKTGTLELELSAETVSAGNTSSSTETVSHNLGYPPAYLPEVGVDWNFSMQFFAGNVPDPFIVNDYLGDRVYMSGPDGQILDVWVDSSNLNMRVIRTPGTYTALTVRMYYTIFYNDISEKFNLLE